MSFTSNCVSYSFLLVCKDTEVEREREREREREKYEELLFWGASQAKLLCGVIIWALINTEDFICSLCKEQKSADKCQTQPMSVQYAARGENGGKIHSVQYDSMVTTLFLLFASKNHQNGLSFLGPGQLPRLCLSTCLIMEDNRPINGI